MSLELPDCIKVLDYGHVRLVESMGSDLSIVRSARVSYDADWRGADEGEPKGKDVKLIEYLWKNRHTSPFEAVTFTFEIKCPIFVARQWHRHRTWSYNEVSRRYTEDQDEEVYVPHPSKITGQDPKNKQARTDVEVAEASMASAIMRRQALDAFHVYRQLLERGVAREIARSVLPQGTYTRFFGTVNLRNLLHFLELRNHEHSQYEIRVYAEALEALARQIVPVTMRVVEENR